MKLPAAKGSPGPSTFPEIMHWPTLLFAVLSTLASPAFAAPKLTAADYESRSLQGWTVHVEKSLADHPRRAEGLDLLEKKLAEVIRLVPASALPKLRAVPLWLSRNAGPGACYHPSAGWLKDNGRVIEMARAIEFQNIDHFIDWSGDQPLMVLHELAHAWHDRNLPQGYANPEILAAFKVAEASKRYEQVSHTSGRKQRHYALTNAMEYFAESTEAYFGRNDFQPYNREELKAFDPAGLLLVERMWGIPR